VNAFKTFIFNNFSQFVFSLCLALIISCTGTPEKNEPVTTEKSLEDSLVGYNKRIVTSEIQEIDDYMQRHHWVMQKTQTGLRYMIYTNGKGPPASQGDHVTIKYSVNLLNGEQVYTTGPAHDFTFEIGKRNVVSGLEEGIMLMNKGGRAKLIVPSHLAFGLLGDLEKIPTRAVLIYDVELCGIEQSKK
jgi:FKBP-type peptidyl-prolyl cis-trans isomerase FkpA